jgi:hypothetical protein
MHPTTQGGEGDSDEYFEQPQHERGHEQHQEREERRLPERQAQDGQRPLIATEEVEEGLRDDETGQREELDEGPELGAPRTEPSRRNTGGAARVTCGRVGLRGRRLRAVVR